MACCKGAEYENWCNDVKIVWTDPETREEYCLFHAPAEHKGMDEETFTLMVTNYLSTKSPKEEIVIEGGIFPFTLKLESLSITTIKFYNCVFHESVIIEKLSFYSILCAYCQFLENFVIYSMNWDDTLVGEKKESGFSLFETTIKKDLKIFNIEKLQNLSLFLTHIENIFLAAPSHFNSNEIITSNKLKLILDIREQAEKDVIKLHNLHFKQVEIDSTVISSMYFTKCIFSKFDMSRVTVKTPINFVNCQFRSMILTAVEVTKFNFRECKFPKVNNRNVTSTAYQYLQPAKDTPTINGMLSIESHEELYRALKKQSIDNGAQLQASDWHYWEKYFSEKRLFTDGTAIEWLALRLYRALSDYGENFCKALLWLITFVSAPFIFDLFVSKTPYFSVTNWWISEQQKAIDYIPLLTRTPTTNELTATLPRCFQVFWQLLITFQATLLGFALRNRYRR